MKAKKLAVTVAASAMLAMSGFASAAEPVELSAAQMDNVTAAGFADAVATALAFGRTTAAVETLTTTSLTTISILSSELSRLARIDSLSLAASVSASN